MNIEEYKERVRIEKDLALCKEAWHLYHTDPRAKDGILFDCFNKKDADNIDKIMKSLYPEVKVYYKY